MSIKQYMTWKNIGKNSTPFPKTNSTEFVGESCKIRQFETFPGLESHLYVTTTFILQLKSTRPTKWHSYHSSIFSSFGFAHDSKTERYQTLILAITPKYNWLLPVHCKSLHEFYKIPWVLFPPGIYALSSLWCFDTIHLVAEDRASSFKKTRFIFLQNFSFGWLRCTQILLWKEGWTNKSRQHLVLQTFSRSFFAFLCSFFFSATLAFLSCSICSVSGPGICTTIMGMTQTRPALGTCEGCSYTRPLNLRGHRNPTGIFLLRLFPVAIQSKQYHVANIWFRLNNRLSIKRPQITWVKVISVAENDHQDITTIWA